MARLGVCSFVAVIGGFLLKDVIVPRMDVLLMLLRGMLMPGKARVGVIKSLGWLWIMWRRTRIQAR